MIQAIQLDSRSDQPLYRQLYTKIKDLILSGGLRRGERIPPTRELAGLLGLNRATVSAAYALLESEGMIRGHVGRGSFVLAGPDASAQALNWESVLPPPDVASGAPPPPPPPGAISFATSRPAEDLFPTAAFRQTCDEVLDGSGAGAVLQLGSPSGYDPLRSFLLEEARRAGAAQPDDDILITNGCQQGLDLLQRVLVQSGDAVLIEDPVYPGLKNLFAHAGARLAAVPVGTEGIELDALERALAAHRPRLLITTPNFQNPTGATMPAVSREAVLRLARDFGAIVVENDIYGELRYTGEPLPLIKQLDDSGHTVLLRSFSKIAFPGLRVGWVIAPRPLVARLAEAKQLADRPCCSGSPNRGAWPSTARESWRRAPNGCAPSWTPANAACPRVPSSRGRRVE
jgi:2-aminoadipate transaminase